MLIMIDVKLSSVIYPWYAVNTKMRLKELLSKRTSTKKIVFNCVIGKLHFFEMKLQLM